MPASALDVIRLGEDQLEYLVDFSEEPSGYPLAKEISGTRRWQFKWFKAGAPTGLSVLRAMKFKTRDENRLVLQTTERSAAS